jgi:hypothetical protein
MGNYHEQFLGEHKGGDALCLPDAHPNGLSSWFKKISRIRLPLSCCKDSSTPGISPVWLTLNTVTRSGLGPFHEKRRRVKYSQPQQEIRDEIAYCNGHGLSADFAVSLG